MIEYEPGKIELLKPQELQERLVSVFRSLPLRAAIVAPALKYDRILDRIRQQQQQQEKIDRSDKRKKSEVVVRKLAELPRLLERANITPFFKASIREAFEKRFIDGIHDGYDSVISTLGVDENFFLSEGIFSPHPAIRQRTERRFHQILIGDLEFYGNPPTMIAGEDFTDEIETVAGQLQAHAEQFLVLYGDPVISRPSEARPAPRH